MEAHHSKAINDFLAIYARKDEFVACVLGGSLAHGYAKANADVDVILVATEDEFQQRSLNRKLAFSLRDICSYEGGYIDCKVVSLASLEQIANRGSDPARFAFKDAKVLWSRTEALEPLLARVVRFPLEQQASREHRFVCQLLAWKWYMSQAEEKDNVYLAHLASQKLTLFACRVMLNRDQALYPYHKWLLEETWRVQQKPAGFRKTVETLLREPSFANAQRLTDVVFGFLSLTEGEIDWPNQFMVDSEMNWLLHEAPVDDV